MYRVGPGECGVDGYVYWCRCGTNWQLHGAGYLVGLLQARFGHIGGCISQV